MFWVNVVLALLNITEEPFAAFQYLRLAAYGSGSFLAVAVHRSVLYD